VIRMGTQNIGGRFAVCAAIVAVALLLSGCTAPKVCDNRLVSGEFEALWETWQGIIALGVLVIFLISGLVYILSGLAAHRGLVVWAKNQMYEGFVTLILAMFAMMLVGFVCSMDVHVLDAECVPAQPQWWEGTSLTNLCSGSDCYDADTNWGSCNPFDVSHYYLQEFRNKLNDAFWYVAGLNFVVAALSTTSICYILSGLGACMSFGQGFSALSQQISNGLIVIVTAQLITMAQILLLKISEKLFGFLLPAGIILRSFGITRGFGGALIAIALGFYLIYPLSIVLFYGMLLDNVDTGLKGLKSQAPPSTDIFSSISNAISGAWSAIGDAVCGFIGLLVVGAVLVPFLTFIVVIAFVKGLSGALGEEVDVSNLTRLV